MSHVRSDRLVSHEPAKWRRIRLCTRRPSNRISSLGNRLLRNLRPPPPTGLGKIQDPCEDCYCTPHLNERSIRDGHWLDALHTELHLWPGPPRLPKGSPQHDVLYRELANQCNLENHQRWTHQRFSRSLLRQESEWSMVQQLPMVGTHGLARYDRNHQFSDRWEHVHIPIRLLVHCLRGNIKEQSDWVSNQSLALA